MFGPQIPTGSTLRYEQTTEAQQLRNTQQEVNAVFSIMHTNVQKTMEREGKLSELDERSKNLERGCAQFKSYAVRLRKKMWYQDMRMQFIIGLIAAILLLLLIIYIIETLGK